MKIVNQAISSERFKLTIKQTYVVELNNLTQII